MWPTHCRNVRRKWRCPVPLHYQNFLWNGLLQCPRVEKKIGSAEFPLSGWGQGLPGGLSAAGCSAQCGQCQKAGWWPGRWFPAGAPCKPRWHSGLALHSCLHSPGVEEQKESGEKLWRSKTNMRRKLCKVEGYTFPLPWEQIQPRMRQRLSHFSVQRDEKRAPLRQEDAIQK